MKLLAAQSAKKSKLKIEAIKSSHGKNFAGHSSVASRSAKFTVEASTSIKRQTPPIGPQPYSEKPEKGQF